MNLLRILWRLYYRWVYCPVLRPAREVVFFPLANHLPRLGVCDRVRPVLFRWAGMRIGRGVKIGGSLTVTPTGRMYAIRIGDGSFVNTEVRFEALGEGVEIGRNCLIGPRVCFELANHHDGGDEEGERGMDVKPIRVEDDVWIGCGAILLPGVTVGKGAVVAAGAVVTRDVEPRTLVAGVPARLKRRLD